VAFDWSGLRDPGPETLGPARELAHYAAQWATRAARANLPAAPDDGHTALSWDDHLQALLSQPLLNGARIGLRPATLELLFVHGGTTDRYALHGRSPDAVHGWLDAKLAGRNLKPASKVELPYEIPARPLARDAGVTPGLEALARWFTAAADALHEVRGKYAHIHPGPGPLRLWPHHFDLAVLVQLEEGTGESARSIGIGISPGDEYYPQPYAYVSPYPHPKDPALPPLPPGAHWHTKDFFGAVATAGELLPLADPRAALLAVIDAAFAAERGWLDG
jgi:hypothetical protein